MNHATARPPDMDGQPITSAQRRALFAAGSARGLDIDGLRSLTPDGSVSRLTRAQAAAILDRLNGGGEHEHPRRSVRRPRRPKGVFAFASEGQRRKIESLRIDLRMSPEELQEWLSQRHHDDGRPMTQLDSTADGVAVIELLKAVVVRSRDGRAARSGPA